MVDEAQWGAQWKGQAHLWGHSVEFPSSLSGQVLLQVSAYAQDQMIESIEVPIEVVLPKTINPQYTPEQISEIESFLVNEMTQFVIELSTTRELANSLWYQDSSYTQAKAEIMKTSAPKDWLKQFEYYAQGFESNLSIDQLARRTDSLNLWLNERSLPYRVTLFESRYPDRPPKSIILSYEIIKTLPYKYEDEILTTYTYNRMDHLNQSELLLGHVSPGISKAIILNYKIADLTTLMSTCLSYHESQCAKIFQSSDNYNFPSDRGQTSELASLVVADWDAKYPSKLPITVKAANVMEEAQVKAVGFHEARHLLHRRKGLKLSKEIKKLLRRKNKKQNIQVSTIKDLQNKINIMGSQYAYASRHNSELAAYLGALAESPQETYFQIFDFYHTAISSIYNNSTEQIVSRIILSELAKINEITGTIDLSRNDYSYWLQYAQQLILIDEVTLRNQAREIYQNQFGEMKRINL